MAEHQIVQKQVQRFPNAQYLYIVGNIHTGCPKVDDTATNRALFCEGFDLSHKIVVNEGFNFCSTLNIYVALVGS